MAGIFVSYRRDDSQGFAGRLADDLAGILGPDRVFRDIEIPIGSDFTQVLQGAIAASDILLVVIGRRWAAESAQGGGSRLFEPTDWVRAEIEAAFAQGKQVVPVLVGGSAMPAAESLPEGIRQLTRLQAATFTDRHWDAEVAELTERLCTLCPALARAQTPRAAAGDNPAQVLRELGDRFLDEVLRRRPRAGPSSRSFKLWQWLWQKLGRGLRQLLTIALAIGAIYAGILLFGDEPLLRQLDAFEARLQIGWKRLLRYINQYLAVEGAARLPGLN